MTTPAKSEKDRVVIFDTTLRDGEQCPGATMTHEEKLEVAELLDTDGRRHHRGRLSDRLGGRFRRRQRDRQAHQERRGLRALARRASRTSTAAAEAIKPARRRRIHTFISTSPVHMKWKLQMEPREGLRDGDRAGDAGAQLHRRRRMVVRGRHPHRARFPLPLRRGRDQGRRHHHQYSRHRRLYGAGGIFRADQDGARARAEFRPGACSRCIATTISAWRWRIRWPACAPARARSSAPSTASASAPATPRSKKS